MKHSMKDRIAGAHKDSKGQSFDALQFSELSEKPVFFKPKAGVRNKIIIVPFKISSKNHPQVRKATMEIGDFDFGLDVFVHKRVGPTNAAVLCNNRTYGKECPICDEAKEMVKQGKDTDLWPTHSWYYNVIPVDAEGGLGELSVFTVSNKNFGKKLLDAAEEEAGGGEMVEFCGLKGVTGEEDGKIVRFKAHTEKFNKIDFLNFDSFDFEDMPKPYPKKFIDQAISFDKLIKVMSAEEIEALMFGRDEPDAEDATPAEDLEPEKKEDESGKKEDKKTAAGECPEGLRFGKDIDTDDGCKNCDVYDDCDKAFRASRKKK